MVLTRDTDVYVAAGARGCRSPGAPTPTCSSRCTPTPAPTPATRGASVYTLSEQGADRAARQAFDAATTGIDVSLPGHDPAVNRILLDLTQRATKNRSAVFAETLLRQHRASETPLLRRSHRDAGFMVLLAPDVPAVLLEMGFITNREDERLLRRSAAPRAA